MEQVLPLYTDDCTYEDVPMGAVNHGKEELRAFGQLFFSGFPDATFEMTSGFVAGTWAGGEWLMRGTHTGDLPGLPATEKSMAVRGSSMLELADGRIRRCTDYWDMAALLRQLGLLPASEQAGA
jgi:steroid delta-isomerase-like uncharacterized protein